jgi:hypothetical protein
MRLSFWPLIPIVLTEKAPKQYPNATKAPRTDLGEARPTPGAKHSESRTGLLGIFGGPWTMINRAPKWGRVGAFPRTSQTSLSPVCRLPSLRG